MPPDTRLEILQRIPDRIDVPLVVVGLDSAGEPSIVYANAALAHLVGRKAEALHGRALAALADAAAEPLDVARLADAARHGHAIELTLQVATADGPRRVALTGSPLETEPPRYLLRLEDVGETLELAARARRLEQRTAELTRLTSDCVYYLRVEPDCRLTLEWSAGGLAQAIGYVPEEVEHHGGWISLVDPSDLRAVQLRSQRFLAGEEASVEYRVRSRTGERCWLRDVGRPQWDDARELVVGVLCVAQDLTEHRRFEECLLAQRLEHRSLISLAGGIVCHFDRDRRLQEVAGGVAGELDRHMRRAVGAEVETFLGAELGATWRRQIERVVPGWPPIEFEFGYGTAEAEEHYRARVCAASGGGVLALLSRQREAAPDQVAGAGELAEPLIAAMVDALSGPAIVLAPDLKVRALNAVAATLIGDAARHVIGRPLVELIAPGSDEAALLDDLHRALEGAETVGDATLHGAPVGDHSHWRYLPLSAGGDVQGVLMRGVASSSVEAQVARTPGESDRLRTIMDHVADGIVAVDRAGVIVALNLTAEGIFGYRGHEVLGRTVDLLIVAEPGENGHGLDRVIGGSRGPGEPREMMGRRKSGEVIPLDLTANEASLDDRTLHVLTVRDITVRKQTEETIRSLAYHDPLTGLPNRLLFNDRLTQAIERARRSHQSLAVMILDLDRFNLINDSLGLASGDRVLRSIGERLSGAVRRSDTVARLSGDDFLLLLPGVDGAENAAKVAQKILDTFQPSLTVDGQELHLGASLGIALYPHDGEEAETLIRNADTALYRAKEHARGSYQFYTTDMNAAAFERLILETQLRRALERGELVLYYQPQVRLDDGAIVGVEALVRWFHVDLGLISPAEFIPLAEETGLILELGRWVLNAACAQVRAWQEDGFAHLRLAVNLSGRQFDQEDLVSSIAGAIEATRFDPADLELELTESSIMRSPEQAAAKLQALDRLGIRLSIDDFGTGYSSLLHLKQYPIKSLKIDQSFIQDISTDANDAAIAQAIIALAESMRLRVIAEGVETPEQLEVLRRYQCDQMQGYLFSKPLPPEEMLQLLRSGRRLMH